MKVSPPPSGGTAVMARRVADIKGLDFYPTPPWATRALFHHVTGTDFLGESVWEPACGEGHMAEVLREFFPVVLASDVKDYGKGYNVGSFIGEGPDVLPPALFSDWIITNPPFKLADQFALRAIAEARQGVALLMRTQWIEGGDRYKRIFAGNPPALIAPFVERVPMIEGRWEPEASSATSYAWFVWRLGRGRSNATEVRWIPPGQRRALTKPDDARRFSKAAPGTDGLFKAKEHNDGQANSGGSP